MSLERVEVLLLWHMHQPGYGSTRAGHPLLPWVRLHATKDYLDMAERVLRRPNLAVTINVVPSLLEQLAAAEAGVNDPELTSASISLADLSDEDRAALALRLSVVPPWARARFKHLAPGFERAAGDAELEDLRALHVLSWIDPLYYDRPAIASSVARATAGQPLDAGDRAALVTEAAVLLALVRPRYRELAQHARSEISVTPYYHPILPLLVDTSIARRAMPNVPLPKDRFAFPADAAAQLGAARRAARAAFGRDAVGLWPSEGSVSPEVVALAREAGFAWVGSDGEVLDRSSGPDVRGEWAHARPWRVGEEGPLLFFRDRELSDKIGFAYSKWPAQDAVANLLARLTELRDGWKGDGPPRLFIALDGENCWEHYPNDGHDFLERLYDALESTPWIATTTPRAVVADLAGGAAGSGAAAGGAANAVGRIETLHSGSWIEANFRIWIGHSEKNAAWDALARARRMIGDVFGAAPPDDAFWSGDEPVWGEDLGGPAPESEADRRRQAWRHLLIAEGSDWFWWFGDDHFTADKTLFDRLLREHLARVYELAGREVPQELLTAIATGAVKDEHVEPSSALAPDISGRLTHYYEWDGAGIWRPAGAGGAMHGRRKIRAIRYGFDDMTLFIRVDVEEPAPGSRLEVEFIAPRGVRIEVVHGASAEAQAGADADVQAVAKADVQAAWHTVAEISIPLSHLAAKPGDRVQWLVLLREGDHVVECAPEGIPLEVEIPGPDFEARNWTV